MIGTVRLGLRLVAVALWLALCLLPNEANRRLHRRHNPWPRRFLRGTARIMGIAIAVRGERAPGRVLLLANHVSWIDILALAATSGSAFVGHDGLAAIAPLRWLARQNDTIFVARHRRGSVAGQIEQLRKALAEMGAVTLFPEGTTGDGRGLLPFKSSLLAALEPLPQGVAVQPVRLDYGPGVADIAWVGEESGPGNFHRVMSARRPAAVTVHFLPPLAAEQLADRKTMTAAAQAAIAAAMAADGTDQASE